MENLIEVRLKAIPVRALKLVNVPLSEGESIYLGDYGDYDLYWLHMSFDRHMLCRGKFGVQNQKHLATCDRDDWLIFHVDGTVGTCTNDDFHKFYERV